MKTVTNGYVLQKVEMFTREVGYVTNGYYDNDYEFSIITNDLDKAKFFNDKYDDWQTWIPVVKVTKTTKRDKKSVKIILLSDFEK